jgi:hypothetical protein
MEKGGNMMWQILFSEVNFRVIGLSEFFVTWFMQLTEIELAEIKILPYDQY